MSLGHLISAKTVGKFDINFSDSDEEQSDIKQKSQSKSQELENGRLDEQKETFLKNQQNKTPLQPFSFKEYQTVQSKYSLNCNKYKGSFLQTFKDHSQKYNKFTNNLNISNNKKLSQKSPFVKQLQGKDGKNCSNRKKIGSELKGRGKELIKQKKRIQLLNSSAVVQDLQQIKLNNQLKRWDTAATQTDSVGKVRQKLLQTMAKNQKKTKLEYEDKGKQILSKDAQENQHSQVEVNELSSVKRQQTASDERDSQHQMDNSQLNFKIPTLNFHSMNQLEFDSESEDEMQHQILSESQEQQQQLSDLSANQQEKYSLFSEEFRTKEYIQMRGNFFDILLGKKSITSELQSCQNSQSPGFLQLQALKYGQNVKRLLTTEIPLNNMFQFQVHVYKDLFKTQYQLWMRQGCSSSPNMEQKILLAAAYNQTFHIDKSTFIIEQVDQNNRRQFIGQLESNFLRDFYVLHGYRAQKQAKLDNCEGSLRRLQANCDSIQEIMNVSLNINRTVYLPNLFNDQQKLSLITFSSQKTKNNPNNLKELYQNDRFDNNFNRVSKLVNSKTCYFDLGFYSEFGIRKSNKTLLMTDSRKGNHTFFIGKIASKKYKLMVGQGLSPLQALGILITHVENN